MYARTRARAHTRANERERGRKHKMGKWVRKGGWASSWESEYNQDTLYEAVQELINNLKDVSLSVKLSDTEHA